MHRHEDFMRLALKEALRGRGTTPPNPLVGAVIVRAGEVVSTGYHEKAGLAHAEIVALENLREPVTEDMTLYVTLEPCSTLGRTGACTTAIAAAGIKRVVIGAIDPNPAHQGKGIAILRSQGIEVEAGILEKECRACNVAFNYAMQEGKPLPVSWMESDFNGCVNPSASHAFSAWKDHLLAAEAAGQVTLVEGDITERQKIKYLFWVTQLATIAKEGRRIHFQSTEKIADATTLRELQIETEGAALLHRGWISTERA